MSRHVNRTQIQVKRGNVTVTARFRKPLSPYQRVTNTSLLMAARRGGVELSKEATLPDGHAVQSAVSVDGANAWFEALKLLQD